MAPRRKCPVRIGLCVLLVIFTALAARAAEVGDTSLQTVRELASDDAALRAALIRIDATPKATEPLERLGDLLLARAGDGGDRRFVRAVEECRRELLARDPDHLEATFLAAWRHQTAHEFRQAAELAGELAQARGDPRDHALLGDALMDLGRVCDAIPAYERLLDLAPGPAAWVRAADVRWVRGDVESALELLRRAAARSPPSARGGYLARWAEALLDAGRRDDAERVSRAALVVAPRALRVIAVRARVHMAHDRWSDAIALLTPIVKERPEPVHLWALAEALGAAGRPEEAEAVVDRLIRIGRFHDPRTLSLFLATTGRGGDEAVDLAERELKTRQDVVTHDVHAFALLAAGRVADAAAAAERARTEGTRSPRLLLHCALIASRSGEREESARLLVLAQSGRAALLPSERALLDRALESAEE